MGIPVDFGNYGAVDGYRRFPFFVFGISKSRSARTVRLPLAKCFVLLLDFSPLFEFMAEGNFRNGCQVALKKVCSYRNLSYAVHESRLGSEGVIQFIKVVDTPKGEVRKCRGFF
jgi:hypothetical protein